MTTADVDKSKIYALAGVFGGVSFGGAYLLGSGITIALGIPIASSAANGFWVGMIIAAAVYILREYRFIATSIMLVYGIAATFSVLLGPPGWQKIIIGPIMGLLWDISFKLIPNLIGQIIGGILFMVSAYAMIIYAMYLQGSPGVDKLYAALPVLLPLAVVSTVIGAIVGHGVIGKRIDKLPVVQRILGRS